MQKNYDITYAPCIKTGLQNIADAMGVCRDTVRKWANQGAPIVVEGEGKNLFYMTEIAALWSWKLAFFQKQSFEAQNQKPVKG